MRKFIFLAVAAVALLWVGCAGKEKKEEIARNDGHAGQATAPAEKKATRYHCPMHPSYISDKPGDCPICGMKLTPIEEEVITVSLPGLADVKISPERQQLIGVRMDVVERRPLNKAIRAGGRVDYDERKVAHIHTRIEGWIKKLFVDYTGQLVKKHQPLFTIYSPELVATQEEYLLALRAKRSLQGNPFQDVASGSATLLEAARRRLLLWEISEAQIAELERTGRPLMEVVIASHSDGFVIEKKALEGMRVEAGEDLYVLADLSGVWVYADIYEYELAPVRVGQEATVTLNAYPGEAFRGKVVYIYPYVEAQTRTARVRVELPNPGWRLKPGMFADVEIRTERGEGLVVPGSAVLDSGERKVVFVDRGEGRFEPREVQLGGRAGEDFEVLQGLSEGERVITSANFLIDSESQIKAALGAMAGHPH
ncbi:MAG: efflux RND transporter periplasmic adaptor subunit [Candidatus Latescibacteria bacterium]|nr:efflux RND transporter periplasmic adaptor subunit [Candidatus Latescibacterota bacterium]